MKNSILKWRPKLGGQTVIAIIIGTLTGFIFPDISQYFKTPGSIFIKLLMMPIFPYVVVALIYGIGSLQISYAKKIAQKGLLVYFVLCTIGMVITFLIPSIFPDLIKGSFYSSSIIIQEQAIDIEKYIPSNPFASLANGMIPAVVFFCVCIGIAVIGMENKTKYLNALKFCLDIINRVTRYIFFLLPLGVFFLTAETVALVPHEQLWLLPVFFVSSAVVVICLTFFILPLFITTFTTCNYKQIFSYLKTPILTVMSTGNLFIVLPMIIENIQSILSKDKNPDKKHDNEMVNAILPVTFILPNLGKLTIIIFILFSAWFHGITLNLNAQFTLAINGFLSLFSKDLISIPYLLKLTHLPKDYFEIYLVAQMLTLRIGGILKVVFLFSCVYITINLIRKKIYIHRKGLLLRSLLAVIGCISIFIIGKLLLNIITPETNTGKKTVMNMTVDFKVPVKVHKTLPKEANFNTNNDVLKRIEKHKTLKVGYFVDAMPFSYFNDSNQLVGLDIDLINLFAKYLSCSLEFFPININNFTKALSNGVCDIVVGGLFITPYRISKVTMSDSYLTETMALVVPDAMIQYYKNYEKISKLKNLKIAIQNNYYIEQNLKENFPNCKIIYLSNIKEFFKNNIADALFTSAEEGSFWTLAYPSYDISVPNINNKMFLGYAMPPKADKLKDIINFFIKTTKTDNTFTLLYNYWILGKKSKSINGHKLID